MDRQGIAKGPADADKYLRRAGFSPRVGLFGAMGLKAVAFLLHGIDRGRFLPL